MHFSWLNIYLIGSQEVVLSAKLYKLWEAAIKATANPAFGLSVSEHANALHLKALGMLIVSCEILAQALEQIIAYHALVSDSVQLNLQHTPDKVGFSICAE
jgi:hypothetical protein